MTEQEAIERCNRLINGMSVNNSTCDAFRDEEKGYPTFKKMIEFAEECKSALEKQIAKKPLPIITDLNEFICMICPTCQQTSVEVDDSYCRKCGQKLLLDWGKEDAE